MRDNSHDIDDALRAGAGEAAATSVEVLLVGPLAREVLTRWPEIERSRQAHELQRRLDHGADRGRDRREYAADRAR